MLKGQKLKKGDKVAVVSLSSGMLGEKWAIHKFEIAKKRMKELFSLELVAMPNALKGIKYIYEHPEARAKDLMDAFKDKEVKAIISAIGGNDAIRILPYLDFEVIKQNPKIFSGFSDTTAIHFMLRKAGINTFYGPAIMTDFSQYLFMNDITIDAINKLWFDGVSEYRLPSSKVYSLEKDKVMWGEDNINKDRVWHKEEKGFELLQGKSAVEGRLLGGCIDVMANLMGTSIWPKAEEWKDKILFVETSDNNMSPSSLAGILRSFASQGIFDKVKGVIVGKPAHEDYYEEYKQIYKDVIGFEAKRPDLPIIYNVNFGHATPITIIPYGIKCKIDCKKKSITITEKCVKN